MTGKIIISEMVMSDEKEASKWTSMESSRKCHFWQKKGGWKWLMLNQLLLEIVKDVSLE